MSSLSTVDAFIRRTPGISPVWSYSSELVHRGAAYSYSGTHWQATAFGAINGLVGAHAAWLGRHGQVGTTVSYTFGMPASLTASVDTRWNWRGWDAAGEVAWKNGSIAGLAAFRGPVGPIKLAFQGRVLPSRFSGKKNGEYALAPGKRTGNMPWRRVGRFPPNGGWVWPGVPVLAAACPGIRHP